MLQGTNIYLEINCSLATVQIDIWRGSMLQGSLATVQISGGYQCCRVVLLSVQIDIWRGSMLQGSLAKCTNRYLEDQCCRVVLLLYK